MKAAYLLVFLGLVSVAAIAQAPAKGRASTVLDDNLTPEFRSWIAANPWFGKDRERTDYARVYAKQLMQEKPGLAGRPLLDAVSRGVAEQFGPAK